MKRAAIYARVSTEREEQTRSLEQQQASLRSYADARGFAVRDDCVYADRASGGTTKRAGFQAMRDAMRRRRVDLVLATRVDRITRSTRDACVFFTEAESLGVGLVFLEQPVDTTSPMGRAMLQLAAIFAELDRGLQRERVTAGIARARARGIHLGRPRLRLPMDDVWRLFEEEGLPPSEIAAKITGTHSGPGGVIEVRHPSPALVRKRIAEVKRAGGLMRWKKQKDGSRVLVPATARHPETEGASPRPATKTPMAKAKAQARRAKKSAKASKRRNRR